MSEKTAEIDVNGWVNDTYGHWLDHFEGNPNAAAKQVFLHLDCMGKRDLFSMKDVASGLRNMAGDEVFKHVVKDGLSPLSIKNSLQKRFLAVARHMLEEK